MERRSLWKLTKIYHNNGNPMAAGVVSLSQAIYAWAPPCPAHGRCAKQPLLARRTSTAGLDGTVTFIPASLPGTATDVVGLAATGNSASLNVFVEQHP